MVPSLDLEAAIRLAVFLSFFLRAQCVQLFNSSDVPSAVPAACASAMIEDVDCSQFVSASYISNQRFIGETTLASLCTSKCASSLSSFQSGVGLACGSTAYEFDGNITQTVPSIVDPLLWAYSVSCITSGDAFCLPEVLNSSSGITACDDCFLQYEAAMLDSDYGRVRIDDDSFSSLLSSCGVPASSYPYTDPATATATSTATVTTTSVASATCTGSLYTVGAGDTCESIAKSNILATDRFISANNLDYNCTTLVAGNQVCVDGSCALYEIKANDTCSGILADQTYTLIQLVSWNPTIHSTCDNLASMIGRQICISPPGTTIWNITTTATVTSWNVTFVLPTTAFTTIPGQSLVPVYNTTYLAPTLANISTSTQTFDPAAVSAYTSLTVYCPITSNDTLAGWTIPDLPDDCEDSLEEYCQPPQDATVPSTTNFPVTCSPSYWQNLASTTSTTALAPTQTGIAPNCDAYYFVVANDTCSGIVDLYGNFTLQQFYSWNPAVGSSCSLLTPGYDVCVGVSDSSFTSSTAGTTAGPTATTAGVPTPLMIGTDPRCTSYYYVEPGNSCYDIEQTYDISADEFNAWNPSIGIACASLYASEYICVGAPPVTSTTTSSSSIPTSTAPSPLEPGTWSNCTTYHYVVSNDGCYDLEQTYGITSTQFNLWNPYPGADCAYLQLDTYVCVAGP